MRHQRRKGKTHSIEELQSILRQMHQEEQVNNQADVTLDGWVARDSDGRIHVYKAKPYRANGSWWEDCDFYQFKLPTYSFPEIKWEDEPIQITIQISKIRR